MPPIKKNLSNINYWNIFLSFLHIILIILLCIIIYLSYYNKQPSTTTEKIVYINNPPINSNTSPPSNSNIPVYPKQLPSYNNHNYEQIGILTAHESDKEPIVLPLFARKLRNHNDRWQYYTSNSSNNLIRLPIKHENKNCEDDIGCKEIYDGETITIDIYQGRIFTVSLYKKETINYFEDVYLNSV
jgi:hypothetical protein